MNWFYSRIKDLGERECIKDSTGCYTYQDLSNRIDTIKDKLINVQKGSVVAILSDYNFFSISLFLCLLYKKCIIVPIVSAVDIEIKRRIKTASVKIVIQITQNGDLSFNQQEKKDDHQLTLKLKEDGKAGLILFSSGSTGEPKAMIHNLETLVQSYAGKKIRKLNILIFLMFDHIGGLNTLLNALSMGACIILPDNRNASDIAELIEKHKVHILPASPTFLNLMLIDNVTEKYDLTSIKMITYGTEPMPAELLHRLRKSFRKTRFLQTFGTSETGIIQTSSKSSDSLEIKLDDPNQEYKIVEGELWLRSKTQILGYLNANMESFTDDGWFRTGDLVEKFDNGYIKIVGRLNEIINVGGEKVLPTEIESVLMELDIVSDALVYGATNAITGQTVVASIVLREDIDKKYAKKEIRKYCITRLSAFKVPTKITFQEKTKFGDRFKKIRL